MSSFPCYVLVGLWRAGKSFMLYQRMQQLLSQGHTWDEMLYVNFEDDRLEEFKSSDFNLILECFAELSDKRPIRNHSITGRPKLDGCKTSSLIGRVARYTPSSIYVLSLDSRQNLFDKPNEQGQACLDSAMARKGGRWAQYDST